MYDINSIYSIYTFRKKARRARPLHILREHLERGQWIHAETHVHKRRKTMRTISIINRKGGVGKSTTASALAYGLAEAGKKVLVVDLDAQANLSYGMVQDASEVQKTIGDVLFENESIKNAAFNIAKKIDLVTSSTALATADIVLTKTGREYKLKEALGKVAENYDYCIIDTPPSLGVLTTNALVASDLCIIPVQAEIYSVQGVESIYEQIDPIIQYCNKDLKVGGILVTRCNERTLITRSMIEMLEENAKSKGTKVYKTKIRECTSVKEAQAFQEDLFSCAPKCNAALDYKEFVKEFLKDERKEKKA